MRTALKAAARVARRHGGAVALRSLRSEPVQQHVEPRDRRLSPTTRRCATFRWRRAGFLTISDVTERRRVAVLGAKAALLLFPGRPMLGETITINGTEFKVVGAVDKISRGNNDFDDQKLYIPVTTMQETVSR